jgi:hypothetical protein
LPAGMFSSSRSPLHYWCINCRDVDCEAAPGLDCDPLHWSRHGSAGWFRSTERDRILANEQAEVMLEVLLLGTLLALLGFAASFVTFVLWIIRDTPGY